MRVVPARKIRRRRSIVRLQQHFDGLPGFKSLPLSSLLLGRSNWISSLCRATFPVSGGIGPFQDQPLFGFHKTLSLEEVSKLKLNSTYINMSAIGMFDTVWRPLVRRSVAYCRPFHGRSSPVFSTLKPNLWTTRSTHFGGELKVVPQEGMATASMKGRHRSLWHYSSRRWRNLSQLEI